MLFIGPTGEGCDCDEVEFVLAWREMSVAMFMFYGCCNVKYPEIIEFW